MGAAFGRARVESAVGGIREAYAHALTRRTPRRTPTDTGAERTQRRKPVECVA